MFDPDDDFVIIDDNIGTEVVRKLRSEIPQDHRVSNDSRLVWLWSQRLATVQSIMVNSPDVMDVMAATLVIGATMANYLPSIELLLQRLEGGAVDDQTVVEEGSMPV
jgi:hypothetical protein